MAARRFIYRETRLTFVVVVIINNYRKSSPLWSQVSLPTRGPTEPLSFWRTHEASRAFECWALLSLRSRELPHVDVVKSLSLSWWCLHALLELVFLLGSGCKQSATIKVRPHRGHTFCWASLESVSPWIHSTMSINSQRDETSCTRMKHLKSHRHVV